MTQLDRLKAALDAALARPNPPMTFGHDRGDAATVARTLGAVSRINRFGLGGAWVGFDYLAPDGAIVLQSMSAC